MLQYLRDRFELARGGQAQNLRPMEGLRGLAVFLVFLVHYSSLAEHLVSDHTGALAFSRVMHQVGNSGVDLFFVLSGYLIYGTLISRQQSYALFMRRRAQRIYPTFAAVFVLYIVLSQVFPQESKIPSSAQEALVYLIANFLLLPGLFPIQPMIVVAWSLSYEMFYYLTLPLVIAAFGLRQRTSGSRSALFLLAASTMVVYCAIFGGPLRLAMFVAGILLYETMQHPRFATPGSALGLLALLLGLGSTLVPPTNYLIVVLKSALLFASFYTLCLASLSKPEGVLGRALSWTPLRWLGNISYSYYLIHGLALKASFLALAMLIPYAHGPWWFALLLPLAFLLSLVPSIALFLAIERPFSLTSRPTQDGLAMAPSNR